MRVPARTPVNEKEPFAPEVVLVEPVRVTVMPGSPTSVPTSSDPLPFMST